MAFSAPLGIAIVLLTSAKWWSGFCPAVWQYAFAFPDTGRFPEFADFTLLFIAGPWFMQSSIEMWTPAVTNAVAEAVSQCVRSVHLLPSMQLPLLMPMPIPMVKHNNKNNLPVCPWILLAAVEHVLAAANGKRGTPKHFYLYSNVYLYELMSLWRS
jgi:hypothetical protein